MSNPEYYDIELYGEKFKACVYAAEYIDNGSLAVAMDLEDGEPFAVITANLENSGKLPANQAYLDTNNDPWAVDFLEKHNLAHPTGLYGQSGYVTYPLYEFNLDAIAHIQ